jgi:L-asparagine permease
MFGAPYTGIATLVFLLVVLVLTAFDYPVGTWTVASLVIIVPALVLGWYAARKRVLAIAQERAGYTGEYPVVANRPVDGEQ